MTKRENVLEKCRINLDNEKVLHSITRVEKEKLQQRIDKAVEYIKENCYDYDYETYSSLTTNEVIELLEILKGEDK